MIIDAVPVLCGQRKHRFVRFLHASASLSDFLTVGSQKSSRAVCQFQNTGMFTAMVADAGILSCRNTACKLRDLRFRIHIHEVQPRVSGKASGTACERTAQSVSGVNPITLTPAKPFDNSFWVCFRER